ncbi:MAG: hypothetical protein ABDH29_03830 [Aquificaceae bacterium]
MPIQEAYRASALSRVRELRELLKPKVEELLKDIDPEDLEFGTKLELKDEELSSLWKEAVEENNYMEVVYTEIMEHHDGAYLKATFRNTLEDCRAERYVSVRSSGRVEVSHALFLEFDGLVVRVERIEGGVFSLFVKAQ